MRLNAATVLLFYFSRKVIDSTFLLFYVLRKVGLPHFSTFLLFAKSKHPPNLHCSTFREKLSIVLFYFPTFREKWTTLQNALFYFPTFRVKYACLTLILFYFSWKASIRPTWTFLFYFSSNRPHFSTALLFAKSKPASLFYFSSLFAKSKHTSPKALFYGKDCLSQVALLKY